MPAGYAPLPTQKPTREADRELDEAFASDEEEDAEERTQARPVETSKASSTTALYDFERDFDYVRPPPGSPPRPSSLAIPNDFGNSNGLIPSSPVASPIRQPPFFHRAMAALFPARYVSLSTEPHSRIVGGGEQNDGVFANVTAKPGRSVQSRSSDGSVHIMPEESQSTAPPSYAAAQADAVPPYWETTIHAPAGMDTDSGMIIDDLPSGSVFTFAANLFTSFFFQFVGFLLTYLLHTTHAAKFGSRAGLGLTLIQYGFYSRAGEVGFGMPAENALGEPKTSKRSFLPIASTSAEHSPSDSTLLTITSREWLSFLLMTLGWFILLSSLVGFWRIKHWEASIRASQLQRSPPLSAEEIEQDITARQTLESVFLLSGLNTRTRDEAHVQTQREREREEARLQHDLHSAGLL